MCALRLTRQGAKGENQFMYLFTIAIEPSANLENPEIASGAYAACWINFKLEDGAEILARYYLEQAGWISGEIKQTAWVDKEDCLDTPTLLQSYEEAEADGACFLFYETLDNEEDELADA
jgi:hypothetical protein